MIDQSGAKILFGAGLATGIAITVAVQSVLKERLVNSKPQPQTRN